MKTSLFIAKRLTRADASLKTGVTERIATLSVSVGIAVMILSLAVMVGFKREVGEKMEGFSQHVTLSSREGIHSLSETPIEKSTELEALIRQQPHFLAMTPYAVKGGILRTDEAIEGVVIKGVGADYPQELFQKWLIEGSLPRIGGQMRTKDILLSKNLARKMQLSAGDKIEILFVFANKLPRRDRFKVSGIYSSGMDEMDDAMLLTDIRNIQRVAQWTENQISGFEIRLDDRAFAAPFSEHLNQLLTDKAWEQADKIKKEIQEISAGRPVLEALDERSEVDYALLRSIDLERQYEHIFNWLKAHDINTMIILIIMLIVAFFNMATALLVLVLQRTRMIGILKVLGMRNRELRHIFVFRSLIISAKGMLWGNLIGLLLCGIQKYGHLIHLDSEGYLLSEVPISVEWGWLVILNLGFFLAITLLMVIPASITSKIKPEQTIKYE